MLRTLNEIGTAASSGHKSSSPGSLNLSGSSPGSTSQVFYSHEADIIFALPKVQLDFKTEHMQGPIVPDPKGILRILFLIMRLD